MGYPLYIAPLLYIQLWSFIIVGSMGFFKNGESQARKQKMPGNFIAWHCFAVVSPAVALSGCSPALPESFQVGTTKLTKKTNKKKNLKLTQELVYVRALAGTLPRSICYKLLP